MLVAFRHMAFQSNCSCWNVYLNHDNDISAASLHSFISHSIYHHLLYHFKSCTAQLPSISLPLSSSDVSALPFPSSYFSSHSLLCHAIFKDAASLRESLIQAPAFSLGFPVRILLSSISPSSRGVEAEHVL